MLLSINDFKISSVYDHAICQFWRDERFAHEVERQGMRFRITWQRTLEGESPGEISTESVDLIKLISNFVKSYAPLLDVELRYEEGLGLYAITTLECNAREAFEVWLNLVELSKRLDIPIFVKWTGENDLPPEEFGKYLGEILAKMDVFLVTKSPFNVIEILKEE